MSEQSVKQALLDILAEIAPEADLSGLPPEADLRQHLDLDSFDFLRLVQRLHERLGVEIPEAEYGRMQTLAGCLAYLRDEAPAPPR